MMATIDLAHQLLIISTTFLSSSGIFDENSFFIQEPFAILDFLIG
jgi:hypothetical protein